jgi:hypothetical protein
MNKNLITRSILGLGVVLAVGLPAAQASAITPDGHHHHPGGGGTGGGTTPPPASGPSLSSIGSLTETANGSVGFVFQSTGWNAHETISLASPGLNGGCAGGDLFFAAGAGFGNPLTVTTDFDGSFNAAVGGLKCSPGQYQVSAQETGTPNRVATTEVTIQPPAPAGTGIRLNPAVEVEQTAGGDVSGSVLVSGLAPALTYTVSSPTLAAACSGGSGVVTMNTVTFGSLAAGTGGKTDATGGDIDVFAGAGCNSGDYDINVTETGAGHSSFDANFAVES